MRVCDITRSDEVTTAFTIIEHEPGENINIVLADGSSGPAANAVTIETGKKAGDALRTKSWAVLNALTPANLRQKDPARTAAAKKAQATKQAKKGQEAIPVDPRPDDKGGVLPDGARPGESAQGESEGV